MRTILRETLYVLAVVLVSLGVVFGAQTAAQAAPSTKPAPTRESAALTDWRAAMVANGWHRLGHPVEGPNGKVHKYCYINTTPDITFLLCFDGYRDVS